ncbi:hypothetical protein AAC387_Pa07g1411 [Persea americana]
MGGSRSLCTFPRYRGTTCFAVHTNFPNNTQNTITFSCLLSIHLLFSSYLLFSSSRPTCCDRTLMATPSLATISPSSDLPSLPHHHQRAPLSSPSGELSGFFSSSLILFSSSLPLLPTTIELRQPAHLRRAPLSAPLPPGTIFSFLRVYFLLVGVWSFRAVNIKRCTAVKPRAHKEVHG